MPPNRAARRRAVKASTITVTTVAGMVEAVGAMPESFRRLFVQCIIQGKSLHVDPRTKAVTLVDKFSPLAAPPAPASEPSAVQEPGLWTPGSK